MTTWKRRWRFERIRQKRGAGFKERDANKRKSRNRRYYKGCSCEWEEACLSREQGRYSIAEETEGTRASKANCCSDEDAIEVDLGVDVDLDKGRPASSEPAA